jgi:hypothetical protein
MRSIKASKLWAWSAFGTVALLITVSGVRYASAGDMDGTGGYKIKIEGEGGDGFTLDKPDPLTRSSGGTTSGGAPSTARHISTFEGARKLGIHTFMRWFSRGFLWSR